MKVQVYADILFLINFCMNYVVLCICKKLLDCGGKRWRMALAAAAGGVYSVCVFFPSVAVLYTFLLKAAVSALIVWISFPTKEWKVFFLRWGVFYLVSFMLGGACMALLYLTDAGGKTSAIVKNGVFYMQLPMKVLAGASAGAYAMIGMVSRFLRNMRGKHFYDVTIHLGANSVRTRGFVDTGNGLTEPRTKRPVLVAGWDVWSSLLPAGCTKDNFVRYVPPERLKLIPYRSVGKKNGVLWAIRVDQVLFADKVIEKPLIGIYEDILSQEYSVLLHRGLL